MGGVKGYFSAFFSAVLAQSST